jgi:hypothetical protein
MRIPLARTTVETHLFLALTPCSCGNGDFPGRGLPWSASVLDVGAQNTVRYDWDCPGCGRRRQYSFRTPGEPEPFPREGETFRWGDGATPSELLDPGQWMLVAERYADEDARRAAAAVDEILLFVKWRLLGGWSVPRSAFRTAAGRARHRRTPRDFSRDRLEIARDGYRDATVKR